jgi:hypothetical protein
MDGAIYFFWSKKKKKRLDMLEKIDTPLALLLPSQ